MVLRTNGLRACVETSIICKYDRTLIVDMNVKNQSCVGCETIGGLGTCDLMIDYDSDVLALYVVGRQMQIFRWYFWSFTAQHLTWFHIPSCLSYDSKHRFELAKLPSAERFRQ